MKLKFLACALVLFLGSPSFASLTVSPSSIDFGPVRIGFMGSAFFKVTNWGPAPARIYGCNSFGSFFCQIQCPFTLPPGGMCSGLIQYLPRMPLNEFQTAQIQTSETILPVFLHGIGVR